MDGAWELLTVCHGLNLNLSPIWLLLFLCPSVNLWGGGGCMRKESVRPAPVLS